MNPLVTNTKRLFAVGNILLAIVAILAAGLALPTSSQARHGALRVSSAASPQKRVKRKPTSGPTISADEKLETATLMLTPDGFEPDELTMPAGKLLLVLNKRIGPRDAEFELRVADHGNVVYRVRMPENTLNWSEIIELHPGNYTLSVVDNPQWVCRIKINAR
jgi:hypothetical protein